MRFHPALIDHARNLFDAAGPMSVVNRVARVAATAAASATLIAGCMTGVPPGPGESPLMDGEWLAVAGYDGTTYTSWLSLRGDHGVWRVVSPTQYEGAGRCDLADVPVAVLRKTDRSITFRINVSQEVPGCRDGVVELFRMNSQSMRGSIAAVGPDDKVIGSTQLTMTRK